MNFKNITLQNIGNFIEGYTKWFLDQNKLLEKHEKEQILWRASQCPPECSKNQECNYCGCDYPQKLYNKKSCNEGKKLPKLMNKEDWEIYKNKLKIEKDNNIS